MNAVSFPDPNPGLPSSLLEVFLIFCKEESFFKCFFCSKGAVFIVFLIRYVVKNHYQNSMLSDFQRGDFFKAYLLWNGLPSLWFCWVFTVGDVSPLLTMLSCASPLIRPFWEVKFKPPFLVELPGRPQRYHGLISWCCPSFRDRRERQEYVHQTDENHPRIRLLGWGQKGLHQAGVSEHLHGHAGYDQSHGHAQDPLQVRAQQGRLGHGVLTCLGCLAHCWNVRFPPLRKWHF